MDPRHQKRREAARAIRVAAEHERGRFSLMDPLFNLREIAKQLVLLEDHLSHQEKQCPDCICKHILTIEALADEAISLDPTGIYAAGAGLTVEVARQWAEKLSDGTSLPEVSKEVRHVRKKLVPMIFDPRGQAAAERVAAVHQRRTVHDH